MNGGPAAPETPPRPPASSAREADRAVRWSCLGVLALTFVWFWPTLWFGLRSDDYLAPFYVDRVTGDVRWANVWIEFVRPWFGAGELYRPLISASYGVEGWLAPGPAVRHLLNVLLVAVAATATAATAGLLAPGRRALAAALAGAVVVLHPGAVETAAWISARVTNLQMAFGGMVFWTFARHLARGRPLWPSLVWFALALASKEGAATLPVTLLALDVMHAPAAPWRARVRLLLPFVVVLGVYLAWRWYVLGRLGPVDDRGIGVGNVANVALRTAQLVAPPDADGAHRLWAAPLFLLALLPLWRRVGAWLVLLPVWWFCVLAPTQHIPAHFATLMGRFVFDALPGVGIALALAAAIAGAPSARTDVHSARGERTAARARLERAVVAIAALGWLAAAMLTSAHWLARYVDDDRRARAVERELAAAAADATPARPFACTGLPYLPLFHQKLWGVLGLRPVAPRDLAVIGLPELLVADEHAPEFYSDAAPVFAVLAAGGTVATLRHDTLRFATLPRADAATLELARDTSGGGGGSDHDSSRGTSGGENASPNAPAAAAARFLPPRAWPGSGTAAVEVRVPTSARSVRLRLCADLDGDRAYGWQQRFVHDGAAWFLTAHAAAPTVLQGIGVPFAGVELDVDGASPPPDTVVVVHAELARRPLPAPVAGAERTRAELDALPRTPPFPGPARLYVMLPTGVRHMDVPAGGAPELSPPLREHLRWALDIFAPLTVTWFWQSPPDAATAPWCSELDWCTAR